MEKIIHDLLTVFLIIYSVVITFMLITHKRRIKWQDNVIVELRGNTDIFPDVLSEQHYSDFIDQNYKRR